jgi:hypothetical protein
MTTLTSTGSRTSRLSVKNKIGLVLAGLLGVTDMASLLGPQPGPGEEGPPMAVLIAGSILGLLTVVAVIYVFRTASRTGSRIVAGTRILSMITALPAFFVEGVPAGLVALAAVGVVVTLLTVWLVLSKPAQQS